MPLTSSAHIICVFWTVWCRKETTTSSLITITLVSSVFAPLLLRSERPMKHRVRDDEERLQRTASALQPPGNTGQQPHIHPGWRSTGNMYINIHHPKTATKNDTTGIPLTMESQDGAPNLEDRSAQLLHSRKGTQNHPSCDPWQVFFSSCGLEGHRAASFVRAPVPRCIRSWRDKAAPAHPEVRHRVGRSGEQVRKTERG